MNSDLMPSSESSNVTASNQAGNKIDLTAKSPKPDNSAAKPSDQDTNGNLAHRQQPIPPPSEPMQYRAIGLVRGRYLASSEQFTQGSLVTSDGAELNAVLLGRIMSLVKNHLDLEQEHLWVVYPRTRQENDSLHIQIVGVWEPENLAQSLDQDGSNSVSPVLDQPENGSRKKSTRQKSAKEESPQSPKVSSEMPDGDFSVRGEVVYQSFESKSLVVKIKQAPRKPTDKPKYFKLKMQGVLAIKAVGKFWDFQVKREADVLMIENAEAIADLPKKRKPTFKKGPRGAGRGSKPFPPRRGGDTPRPVKKAGDVSATAKPSAKTSAPKPVKRPKSEDNS